MSLHLGEGFSGFKHKARNAGLATLACLSALAGASCVRGTQVDAVISPAICVPNGEVLPDPILPKGTIILTPNATPDWTDPESCVKYHPINLGDQTVLVDPSQADKFESLGLVAGAGQVRVVTSDVSQLLELFKLNPNAIPAYSYPTAAGAAVTLTSLILPAAVVTDAIVTGGVKNLVQPIFIPNPDILQNIAAAPTPQPPEGISLEQVPLPVVPPEDTSESLEIPPYEGISLLDLQNFRSGADMPAADPDLFPTHMTTTLREIYPDLHPQFLDSLDRALHPYDYYEGEIPPSQQYEQLIDSARRMPDPPTGDKVFIEYAIEKYGQAALDSARQAAINGDDTLIQAYADEFLISLEQAGSHELYFKELSDRYNASWAVDVITDGLAQALGTLEEEYLDWTQIQGKAPEQIVQDPHFIAAAQIIRQMAHIVSNIQSIDGFWVVDTKPAQSLTTSRAAIAAREQAARAREYFLQVSGIRSQQRIDFRSQIERIGQTTE